MSGVEHMDHGRASTSYAHSIRTAFSIDPTRLSASELEVGITDAIQKPVPRKVVGPQTVTQRTLDFEHSRPRWVREMFAEAIGIFFYVYPGMAATCSVIVSHRDPVAGSTLQIGWAYGMSIPLAIALCGATSGGHFNPAITLCFAFYKRFPWWKIPHYVFAQIVGAFLAALLVLTQYHLQIQAFVLRLQESREPGSLVYPGGPAAIISTYPPFVENNLGYLFLTEWMACCYVALIVWAATDPGNPFVNAYSAPLLIGFAYATMIWGFGATAISMNFARDLGARLVGLIYFGPDVFFYRKFSWIPLFVNIPATFFATTFYELVMKDSLVQIGNGIAVHAEGEEGLEKHLEKQGMTRDENGRFVRKAEEEYV